MTLCSIFWVSANATTTGTLSHDSLYFWTRKGWASVLNTHSDSGSISSSENRRYRYWNHRGEYEGKSEQDQNLRKWKVFNNLLIAIVSISRKHKICKKQIILRSKNLDPIFFYFREIWSLYKLSSGWHTNLEGFSEKEGLHLVFRGGFRSRLYVRDTRVPVFHAGKLFQALKELPSPVAILLVFRQSPKVEIAFHSFWLRNENE